MNRKSSLILALTALVLAGCQKNDVTNIQGYNDGTVKYAVDLGNSSHTKGELVNTTGDDKDLSLFNSIIGEFYAKAYDQEKTEVVSQTVKLTNGIWVATPKVTWPENTELSFLTYANLPGEQTASITSDGVTMSHIVPTTAGSQTDILFGYYQGDGGGTATALIRFDHPLTAVRFQRGEMDESIIIKSISLNNVAGSGTATMAPDGTITWSNVNSYTATVSQTSATGLTVNETSKILGDTFIIIPQKLGDHNVTVSVVLGTEDGETTVTAKLISGEWKQGFSNTYKLSYSTDSEELELTAASPEVYIGDPLGGGILSGGVPDMYNSSPLGSDDTEQKVPIKVDLGLSVKWASMNIGAPKPEEVGWYFFWGGVTGYVPTKFRDPYTNYYGIVHYPVTWINVENGDELIGGFSGENYRKNFPDGEPIGHIPSNETHDAAVAIWGGDWRIPTNEEFQELIDNCDTQFTYDYKGTGVSGVIFTSKKEGYSDKSIFLPATGDAYNDEISLRQISGNYSSTGSDYSYFYNYNLGFDLIYENIDVYTSGTHNGVAVRPVSY